ncbi:hypothetical protein OEZ86_012415 [Tetradesmus obliquus]|nr:hypothetical protein OEZ86_012415 [Tetradesmus obliquus]
MANPQVEHWFRLADEDRDGGVGGAEAVRFFTKSGLPQEVLGQIWEYASGGGAKLNMGQFAVAMRLVALAQASGGRLMPDQARVVAMGGGPQLPPPRLAGVTDAPAPHIPTYTPQITGLAPQPSSGGGVGYSPQPTGGYMPQVTGGYPQQQMTGGMRPPSPYGTPPPAAAAAAAGPTGQYTPQATGYLPAGAGPTGGMAAAGGTGAGVAALPGFPPVTVADLQRYQATFAAVDTDRDGFAKGGECFPVFIKSGLDKALLKRMWDLVAGNAGSLDAQQFLKCMYLMDGCRRGAALPAALPPGPWPQASMVSPAAAGMTGPPGMMQQQQQPPAAAGLTGAMPGPAGLPPAPQLSAGGARDSSSGGMAPLPGTAPLRAESWSLENQFGHKGAVKSISEAYDQTLPKIPDLPGKITFNPAALAAAAAGPSSVPDLDATIADMLVPADKARWEAERSEALEKEKQERQVAADAAAAKARVEAFNAALSELVMYRSRVNVALLQASDSAARLAAEAEDTELRYNKARLAAQSQEEEGKEARQKLQALLARKQEAANKLELLQQEIAMMANLNPAELAALEKEVGALVAAMAAAEAQKAAMEMQLDSGKKQKGLLGERIADLELAAAAGEGDIRRARAELAELQAKLSAAQASVQGGPDLGEVGPLLGKAASAYRRLYSSAAAAGLEVPYEANLNNVGSLVWLEQLMAGTADWVDDDAALSGYTLASPADAAAAAGISIEPPAERHFADEDDSDITSPMGHNLMSAVPGAAGSSAAAGGTPVVIGGLAGFDPSLYRLNTDQRQLATQYSMDSSYAGSMAGGAAAGGTGASSSNGFGDDAAFGESSTPGGEDGKAAGSLMGFEDNAF